MKVGVIQSNYIPWRGYFDFIDAVDLFIFHDDLQYTKNDWRNRNRILTPDGLRWLTVPVHYRTVSQRIDEVQIDYRQNWSERHLYQLEANYRRAPFFQTYVHQFANIISQEFSNISELNVALCKWVMQVLEIPTPTLMSRELNVSGKKSERLIDLLTRVNGTTYLSGPSAAAYLDLGLFHSHGIQVDYKSYDYPPYPQFRDGFCGDASILDLIFNTGPAARQYMKSRTPDRIAACSIPDAQFV
jgi:hypothetical protein